MTLSLDNSRIHSPSINYEFETHIPDIHLTELQLNKANTSDKETFHKINIKVIGSDVHTNVYDKLCDFGFQIANLPRFSGDVPRLQNFSVGLNR